MYEEDGSHVSTQLIGSTAFDQVWDVTGGSNGLLYAVGATSGNFVGANTNAGENDGFLTRLVAGGSGDYLDSKINVTPNGDGTYTVDFAGISDPNGLTGVIVNYYLHHFDDNGVENVFQTAGNASGWTLTVTGAANISQWYAVITYVDNAGDTNTIDTSDDPGLVPVLAVNSPGGGGGGAGDSTSSGGGGGSSSTNSEVTATPEATPTPQEIPTGEATIATTQATTSETQEKVIDGSIKLIDIESIKPKKVSTFELIQPIQIRSEKVKTLIVGTKKKDKITGSSEGEVLAGGEGKDVLSGGDGADGFFFQNREGFGKKAADKIMDFDSTQGDSVLLARNAFSLGKKVKLKTVASKKALKKALNTNNSFVYYEKKGFLYFNENGKEKGWGDGGLLAILQGKPELVSSDLTIV